MSGPHWRPELDATVPVHRSVDQFPPPGSMWTTLTERKREGQWLPHGSHVATWCFPNGQSDVAEARHRMPQLPSILASHSVVNEREERENKGKGRRREETERGEGENRGKQTGYTA